MRSIVLFTAAAVALILAVVGGWMSSTTQARIDTPPDARIDVRQLTTNAAPLPTDHPVDFSLVFE
jgi:hypothetical protein